MHNQFKLGTVIAVLFTLAAPVFAHEGHDHGPTAVSHGGLYEEGSTLALTIPGEVAEEDPIQWYRDGVALSDGGTVSGAEARTLVIEDLTMSDAGNYSAEYVNPHAGHDKDVPKHGAATFGPVTIVVVGVGTLPAAGPLALLLALSTIAMLGLWQARYRNV